MHINIHIYKCIIIYYIKESLFNYIYILAVPDPALLGFWLSYYLLFINYSYSWFCIAIKQMLAKIQTNIENILIFKKLVEKYFKKYIKKYNKYLEYYKICFKKMPKTQT